MRKLQTHSGHRSGMVSVTPFLDAAQDIGTDDAISTLFSVLTGQIAGRVSVYEGRSCLNKFPIRILTEASLW